ncbi:MAG: DUF5684 domain-containing protein [Actinomycetota bacterium]|nr:DUF5684 domain-containing protein [Actinomycetota bacterium]
MANTDTAFATMAAGLMGFIYFFSLLVSILYIVSLWKIFAKAGKPGWASIVPIYNVIVMLEITGKPIWWIILLFIPVVNLVISIIVIVELANKFGKSGGFAVGLIFLPVIFYPILAFSDAEYIG